MINIIFKSNNILYICDEIIKSSLEIFNIIKIPEDFNNSINIDNNDIFIVDTIIKNNEYSITFVKKIDILDINNEKLKIDSITHEKLIELLNNTIQKYDETFLDIK